MLVVRLGSHGLQNLPDPRPMQASFLGDLPVAQALRPKRNNLLTRRVLVSVQLVTDRRLREGNLEDKFMPSFWKVTPRVYS